MALVRDLKTSAQDFTASWVDYGSEISSDGHVRISLWFDIDINDTTDVRVRILAKHTRGGADEYTFPIETISDTYISVKDEYVEFAVDVDGKHVISFELDEIIPFVQVQIQAGTVGASAGQMLSSKYIIR
jgi:hypothetical protein